MKIRITQFLVLTTFLLLMCFAKESFSQVSGTVYQDFNGNGVKESTPSFNEVGMAGVTVIATNATGTSLTVSYTGGGGSTNATGSYAVTGGTIGQIRLEFIMPDGHTFASRGAASGTTVMFPSSAIQDLGVFYPGSFSSESNPRIATQYYTNGDNQVAGSTASSPQSLVTFPHSNGTLNSLANMGSTGVTWGLAFHKQSGKLFSAALAKRHANTGSLGLSGIYVSSNAQTANSLGGTTSFVNLSAINPAFNVGSVSRNFAPGGGNATGDNQDEHIFDLVGKIGMGGLEVSDDGRYLYTVNLNDRRVWRIELGPNGTAPTLASQIVPYAALPNSCTGSTFRPFALKFYKGELYVGGVCDGVGSGSVDRNNLRATVYKVNAADSPSGASFTQVLSFPLNFNRQANIDYSPFGYNDSYIDPNYPGGITSISAGAWRPWARSIADFYFPTPGASNQYFAYPQPMLVGLEFDVDGSLILGFGDRSGFQFGNENFLPDQSGRVTVVSGGDLLRAYNNNGTFVLENNGTAGLVSTAGANNGQGPGGGEFYFEDAWSTGGGPPFGLLNPSTSHHFHDETAFGALAVLHGSELLMANSYNPRSMFSNGTPMVGNGGFSGGVRWLGNTDGRVKDGLTMYGFVPGVHQFGKAAGMGDLELLTGPAPIEIGNRVWLDSNNNGIQDAGETGISGITVTLYAANGTSVLGTATTNAQGEYYFSSGTGISASHASYNMTLLPGTTYILSFPTSSGGYDISTNVNAGSNDLIDTDANVQGRITFTTGSSGENNHSFDVGYFSCPMVNSPVTATVIQPTCSTNGRITVTGFTNGDRFRISDGAVFGAWSLISTIPAGGIIVNSLPNQTRTYTVRIYGASNDSCFKDVVLSTTVASPCCPTGNCGTATAIKNSNP